MLLSGLLLSGRKHVQKLRLLSTFKGRVFRNILFEPISRLLLYLHIPEKNLKPVPVIHKNTICKTSPPSANCYKPIGMSQPLS